MFGQRNFISEGIGNRFRVERWSFSAISGCGKHPVPETRKKTKNVWPTKLCFRGKGNIQGIRELESCSGNVANPGRSEHNSSMLLFVGYNNPFRILVLIKCDK